MRGVDRNGAKMGLNCREHRKTIPIKDRHINGESNVVWRQTRRQRDRQKVMPKHELRDR